MGSVSRTFRHRRDAGRVLATHLSRHRGAHGLLVLGLARGGVPVGWEVAASLGAAFDVFLVRKLGVPHWPELAMGAVATGGGVVLNKRVLSSLRISPAGLQAVIDRESAELRRREHLYRGDRPPLHPRGRTVIVVDDGIATGASMLAAVRALRAFAPAAVIVAVPVGPKSVCASLSSDADDVVCVSAPEDFEAVGQMYANFRQVGDDEVREFLATRPVI